MPAPHPGVVQAEIPAEEDLRTYEVRALVMHVVRGQDKWGNPDVYAYSRGDKVQLNPSYAKPYLEARLLAQVEDEPKRPVGKAARRNTPSQPSVEGASTVGEDDSTG